MIRVVKLTIIFVLCTSLLSWATSEIAQSDTNFSSWLAELREEALGEGIQQATLDEALTSVLPLTWIIDADRNQPEFKKSLDKYLDGILTPQRVERGRQMLAENRLLLFRISKQYHVSSRFIVELRGIETYYGKHTGKVPIIDALVTLAYDGRRSDYFRQELFNALKIIDAGHISYEKMKGSWAGAMGQLQFMPSSFLKFAVDGNGDGRIDLWQTKEDYLSSAANYLAKVGWESNRSWGLEVVVPRNFDRSLIDEEQRLFLETWREYGLRTLDGNDFPQDSLRALLIQPEGHSGRSFLVFENYHALMKWNRAASFALAVGMLADRIAQ